MVGFGGQTWEEENKIMMQQTQAFLNNKKIHKVKFYVNLMIDPHNSKSLHTCDELLLKLSFRHVSK